MTGVDTSLNDTIFGLLDDWRVHLRARNRRPGTIKSYLSVARDFSGYLQRIGHAGTPAAIRREHVEAYLADLGDRTSAANTAKHYRSLQQLFRWLVDDGELRESPMARMRPPAVPEQPCRCSVMTRCGRCSRPRTATPSRTAATRRSSGCSSTPGCAPRS